MNAEELDKSESPLMYEDDRLNKTSKRIRIANACQVCRERKVRCDGQLPVCGSCLRRRCPCDYARKNSKSKISPNYVKELESKIKFYEGRDPNDGTAVFAKQPVQLTSTLLSSSSSLSSPATPFNHVSQRNPLGMTDTTEHQQQPNIYTSDPSKKGGPGFYDHFSVAQYENQNTLNDPSALTSIPVLSNQNQQHQPPPTHGSPSNLNNGNGSLNGLSDISVSGARIINGGPILSKFPVLQSSPSQSTGMHFTPRTSYGFPPVGNVPTPQRQQPQYSHLHHQQQALGVSQAQSQAQQQQKHQQQILVMPASFPLASPSASNGSSEGSAALSKNSMNNMNNMNNNIDAVATNSNCTSTSSSPSDTKSSIPSSIGASTSAYPRGSFFGDITGGPSALSFMKLVEAATGSIISGTHNDSSNRPSSSNKIENYAMKRPQESTGSILTSMLPLHSEYRNDGSQKLKLRLPDRNRADAIVNSYFSVLHVVFPIVHEPTFRKQYNELWDQNEPLVMQDLGLFVLMNLVFSISALMESESLDVCPEGEMYFQIAVSHIDLGLLTENSLLTVQCLLLACAVSMRICNSEMTFYFFNTAVYSAQNLGLHIPQRIASIKNLIEKEISIRVWIYCYCMDKLLSVTYGKALLLSANPNTLLPSRLDDEYITDTSYLTPSAESLPSYEEFTVAFFHLFDIVDDIIRTFYEPFSISELESSSERTLSSIFRLEQKIQALQKEIPSYLSIERWVDNDEFNLKQQTQSTIFQCRFLHAKILLYRVIMMDRLFKLSPYESTLKQAQTHPHLLNSPLGLSHHGYLQQCFETSVGNLSVATSIQIIELIHRTEVVTEGPVRWLRTFYVYMACVVLMNAKLLPVLDSGLNQESVAKAWKMAVETIRSQSSTSMIAGRCLKVLEAMHEKISSYGTEAAQRRVELLPIVDNYDFDIGDTNILRNILNDAYLFPLFKG